MAFVDGRNDERHYPELDLTDNAGSYVLIAVGHVECDKYAPIFSKLKIGDTVQVWGGAGVTQGVLATSSNGIRITAIGVDLGHAPYFGIISPSRVEKIGGTLNWKIYRNEKYGFEVKYPPNYEIRNLTAENRKYNATLQFLIEFCDRTSTGCSSSVQIYNGVFREPSVGEETYVNKLKRNGFTYWLGGEKDILSTFKFFR